MKSLQKLLYILSGLLNEKEIVLGPTLIQILKDMKNPVANFVLNCADKKLDIDADYSYINFDKQDSMVSFLKTRWDEEAIDKFDSKRREKMKISRLVTALMNREGVNFSPKDISDFVDRYKASQKDYEFSEVEGRNITNWYSEDNYKIGSDKSSLANSCMRGDECRDFFTVYEENPDVRLLILVDNESDKLMGRAIVWYNINLGNKVVTYMDRVYVYNDYVEQIFKDYAISKGYWHKVAQTNENMSITDGKDVKNTYQIWFELSDNIDWEDVQKPYMDTLRYFTYMKKDKKYVPILTNNAANYKESWLSTSGGCGLNHNYVSEYDRLLAVSKALNIEASIIHEDDQRDKVIDTPLGKYLSVSSSEANELAKEEFIKTKAIDFIDPSLYIHYISINEIWNMKKDEIIENIVEKMSTEDTKIESMINKVAGASYLINYCSEEEIKQHFEYYVRRYYNDVLDFLVKNGNSILSRFINLKKYKTENINLESIKEFSENNVNLLMDFYNRNKSTNDLCISFLKYKISRLKMKFFLRKFTHEQKKFIARDMIFDKIVRDNNALNYFKSELNMSDKEIFNVVKSKLSDIVISRVAINLVSRDSNLITKLLSIDNKVIIYRNYYIYKVK